jgi:DNA polymerase elongation subunit (family B)
MEPRSAFYTSPVVVLDFQSLYPSQVIACVGTVMSLRTCARSLQHCALEHLLSLCISFPCITATTCATRPAWAARRPAEARRSQKRECHVRHRPDLFRLCSAPPLPGGSLANVRRAFGVTELALQPGVVPALAELVHITPNGAMFAPPATRPGVLPRLLSEVRAHRVRRSFCVSECTEPSSPRRSLTRASWSRRRSRRRRRTRACCSAASPRASWA